MKHVSWVIALVVGFAVGFFGRGALDVNKAAGRAPLGVNPTAPTAPNRPTSPPREDPNAVYRVAVDDTPMKGPADALVTIVESSDFECPFCKRVAPTLKQVEQAYAGKVRFSFRHNPLRIHAQALPAAMAAEEVRVELGPAKFWQAADALFALQQMDENSVVQAAVSVGADAAKVRAAVTSKKFQDRVDRDQTLLNSLGATATPTFFVNGRKIEGAVPYEAFKTVIDEELAKAQATVRGGTSPSDVYTRIAASGATSKVMLPGGAPAPGAPGSPPSPPSPPPSEFKKVSVRPDDPVKGASTAKLTVVIFSDFQCPFCARVEPSLHQLEEALGDQVRFVWKHEPLPMHPNAMPAAQAAEAAREQGKFWPMHDKLFANQNALDPGSLARYAGDLGLNMGRYQSFVSAGKGSARIKEDQAEAQAVGANGTPNMFFNCRQVVGAQPYDKLKAVADEELKKADAILKGKKPDASTYEKVCDENVSKGAAYAQEAAANAARSLVIRPDDPAMGNARAPVTVVLFSDFQCPFCRKVEPTIAEVEKTYGSRVRVVWKHLPLPPTMHPQAEAAAEAAEAAREQGKFWEMHDALFANQDTFRQPDAMANIARKVGLDMGKFQASLNSGNGKRRVLEDQAMAQRMNINGTPAMVVNGETVSGAVPFEQLKAVIDRKLSAARE